MCASVPALLKGGRSKPFSRSPPCTSTRRIPGRASLRLISGSVREAISGTGSGGSWYSPTHSALGPCPVSVLRAQLISLLEPRSVRPTAQSRPLEESAGFPPGREESPNYAPGLCARNPLPEHKETFRPAPRPERRSLRKCVAEGRRPAEMPLPRPAYLQQRLWPSVDPATLPGSPRWGTETPSNGAIRLHSSAPDNCCFRPFAGKGSARDRQNAATAH